MQHQVQNVTFEDINFILRGGVNTTDQKVMEYDGGYPEGSKFGNTPVWAFYVRHTDEINFIRCRVETGTPDARKWLVTENVGKTVVK